MIENVLKLDRKCWICKHGNHERCLMWSSGGSSGSSGGSSCSSGGERGKIH